MLQPTHLQPLPCSSPPIFSYSLAPAHPPSATPLLQLTHPQLLPCPGWRFPRAPQRPHGPSRAHHPHLRRTVAQDSGDAGLDRGPLEIEVMPLNILHAVVPAPCAASEASAPPRARLYSKPGSAYAYPPPGSLHVRGVSLAPASAALWAPGRGASGPPEPASSEVRASLTSPVETDPIRVHHGARVGGERQGGLPLLPLATSAPNAARGWHLEQR